MTGITKEQFKKLRALHRKVYDALPEFESDEVSSALVIAEKIGESEWDVANALTRGCCYAFATSRRGYTPPPIDVYYCKGVEPC